MQIEEKPNSKIKLKGYSIRNDGLLDVEKPLPNTPGFRALFVGQSGSGKTSLLINLLLKYYRRKFHRIYLFTGSLNTVDERLLKKLNPDRIFGDLEHLDDIVADIRESEDRCLFIFDDLVREVREKARQLQAVSYNARHIGGSISQIYVTQKLNEIPLLLRSNMSYIFYWNLSNRRELDALYTDYITGLDREQFDAIIRHIKERAEPHDFLYIRLAEGKFYRRFNEIVLHAA